MKFWKFPAFPTCSLDSIINQIFELLRFLSIRVNQAQLDLQDPEELQV